MVLKAEGVRSAAQFIHLTRVSALLLNKVYLETGAIRVGKMLYVFGSFVAPSKATRQFTDERGVGNLL